MKVRDGTLTSPLPSSMKKETDTRYLWTGTKGCESVSREPGHSHMREIEVLSLDFILYFYRPFLETTRDYIYCRLHKDVRSKGKTKRRPLRKRGRRSTLVVEVLLPFPSSLHPLTIKLLSV